MGDKEKIKLKIDGKEEAFNIHDLVNKYVKGDYFQEMLRNVSRNMAIMGTAKWVIPQAEKKFKKGDKIKITKVSTTRPWLIGETGEVSRVDYEAVDKNLSNFPVQIKLDNAHGHTGGYIWLHKDDEWEELYEEFEELLGSPDGFNCGGIFFDDYAEKKDTELYCDCWEPDIVKNMACGEEFDYCRNCKKEKL